MASTTYELPYALTPVGRVELEELLLAEGTIQDERHARQLEEKVTQWLEADGALLNALREASVHVSEPGFCDRETPGASGVTWSKGGQQKMIGTFAAMNGEAPNHRHPGFGECSIAVAITPGKVAHFNNKEISNGYDMSPGFVVDVQVGEETHGDSGPYGENALVFYLTTEPLDFNI